MQLLIISQIFDFVNMVYFSGLGWIRTSVELNLQIYSLSPSATRAEKRGENASMIAREILKNSVTGSQKQPPLASRAMGRFPKYLIMSNYNSDLESKSSKSPKNQQFQIQNVARNTEYKTLLPCSSPSKIKKN